MALEPLGRQIAWDVETTGFEEGDRIVEFGAVEVLNGLVTSNHLHFYCDPGIPMPEGAFRVHGLSSEFLSQFPPFEARAAEIQEFFGSDATIAHNGKSFDGPFLNKELRRIGLPEVRNEIIDTLILHRRRYPGRAANLDAILDRLGVDRSSRDKHGALLDSQLLVPVYIHLIGRDELIPEVMPWERDGASGIDVGSAGGGTQLWFPSRPIFQPDAQDLERHAKLVAKLPDSIWARIAAIETQAPDAR